LSSFSCEQDEDIEQFLLERAVEFEKLSKARTYLICDQEQLENPNFQHEQLIIYGYISLALKVLSIPESTSNRARKELDGFSAKIHGEKINDFPCYLLGQLSKNSNVPRNAIRGETLINFAYDIIAASVDAVGGRYMMVECRDIEKLIHFYENNSFKAIAHIPDNNQPMVQMIRKIS
jgi:hypothetical protein